MKPQNRKKILHETVLPKNIVQSWEKTLIEFARIRGLKKDEASHTEKLQHVLKAEKANVKKLWEAFTTERDQLPRYLLDPKKQTAAYLLGFHLPNAARMWNLLYRFGRDHSLDSHFQETSTNCEIVDIGCGTGAMSQTLIQYLNDKKVHSIKSIIADKSPRFLETATSAIKHTGKENIEVQSIKSSITSALMGQIKASLSENSFRFIILGYVWNELAQNQKARAALQEFLTQQAEHRTMVLIVEPANQFIARDAMELRDELVFSGYNALYPCGHNHQCPMLKREKDWCFSDTTWKTPGLVTKLNQSTKINQQQLRYSGYVFASERFTKDLKVDRIEGAVPVVGKPSIKDAAQGFEYLVCEGEKLAKYPTDGLGDRILNRGQKLHTAKIKNDKPAKSSPFKQKKIQRSKR